MCYTSSRIQINQKERKNKDMAREQFSDNELFSWNRVRSDAELGDFIARKISKFEVGRTEVDIA
jgi:hypothetical protein